MEENISDISKWPSELGVDYPFAAIRLTTLEHNRTVHLLFGYVELIPAEIPTPFGYVQKFSGWSGGPRIQTSLSVIETPAALQWYESALNGRLTVPKRDPIVPVISVSLAAEPKLGRFVATLSPPIICHWHAGPRMNRLVPMEDLPKPVIELLSHEPTSERGMRIASWLERHVFIDLTVRPDCAGGLMMLAPNPLIRGFEEFPGPTLEDGTEVIAVKLVPRRGASFGTLTVRLSEHRPNGVAYQAPIELDHLGRARIILPQRASRTSVEITCAERGVLYVGDPQSFLRKIGLTVRLGRGRMDVEVPARKRAARSTRHTVYTTDPGFESNLGEHAADDAETRLVELIHKNAARPAKVQNELFIVDGRDEAVEFIRRLVNGASTSVLFIDPYFSYADVRDFALAVSFRQCDVGFLTGRDEPRWREELTCLSEPAIHGEYMLTDLEYINQRRLDIGARSIDGRVMGGQARSYHDRFLIVDQEVWHLGHSFNALGDGHVTMIVKLQNPANVLPALLEDFERATSFQEYWSERGRVKPITKLPTHPRSTS